MARRSTRRAAIGGPDEGDPNAIVVTAQKRTQRLLDVPQSVSVISGQSLENQHAQRLSDYLTRIPSANIVESQPGNSRIVLRGINAGGVGATVATYIDETPFGSATSLANGGILAPDIDPFDLGAGRGAARPAGHAVRRQLAWRPGQICDRRARSARLRRLPRKRESRTCPMATSAIGRELRANIPLSTRQLSG